MSLTTSQKVSLSFGFYVFLFVVVISFMSIFASRIVLLAELKGAVAKELTEVVRNHLLVSENQITAVKDKAGIGLAEELVESGSSALILDRDFNILKGYGRFEFYNEGDRKSIDSLTGSIISSLTTSKIVELETTWGGKSYLMAVSPIKKDGVMYGAIVIGRPTTTVDRISQTLILIFSLISVAGVFGSLFVSGSFNRLLEKISAMGEQQKEFTANAAHELKTPLARAVTSLELGKTEEVKSDLFGLSNLIDDLLFLSKLQRGADMPTGYANIYDVLALVTHNNVRTKIEVPKNMEVFVPKEYLKIILTNLVSNALKYSDKEVVITGKQIKKKVVIEVKDFGEGINKDELNKVFDRFYRGSKTGNRFGHGVGLAIVKRICDLYNVKIIINSKPGEGTTVLLTF